MKAILVALWLVAFVPVHAVAAPASGSPANASRSIANPASAAPQAQEVRSSGEIADPMFGIRVHAIGLERTVRVYQWHPDTTAAGGYGKIWSSERIGPDGLDAAHANPAEFPINGQRWWSADAKLDGHPVATAVLTALEADADARNAWSPVKPDLAQLPPNLAATFQPDGPALTTSQDAAHPQVGDVDVQWRAIVAARPPAGVLLVDGHWEMPASGATAAASIAASGTSQEASPPTTSGDVQAWLRHAFGKGIGWFALAGVALAILVLVVLRRRRRPRRRR